MKGKILFFVIFILMLAFVAYLLRVAFVGDPFEGREEFRNLRLTQEGFEIMANWDAVDNATYDVNVNRAGQIMALSGLADNNFTISNVTPGKLYSVTVRARLKSGDTSSAVSERIIAAKASQPIGVNVTEYYGFAGNDFKIKTTAVGEIEFRSDNKEVAEVSADGRVTMKQPGDANIIISASGDDFYEEAEREIPVCVYPETLDKIKQAKLENINGLSAVIRWKDEALATAYTVLKRNPATDEYETIAEVPADITYYEVPRDNYDYVIKGVAEVGGRKIDGRASDPVEVRGLTEEAPSYNGVKIIKTLDDQNLDLLATIEGPEKTKLPQAICVTENKYVVTYLNKKGSRGNLASYNKDGSFDKITNADGIGHGNGITYNPYSKLLYVPKTQIFEKTKKLRVYDGESRKFQRTAEAPEATSCIAYDPTNNKYYFSYGETMYVSDGNFKLEKTLKKTVRWFHTQDIGGYNGMVLVCTWIDKSESYIDLYRISDGAYLGSYYVPVGEIESCDVDDGYLVLLINKKGPLDRIYRTKERIAIP